jgi:hypothetical protein
MLMTLSGKIKIGILSLLGLTSLFYNIPHSDNNIIFSVLPGLILGSIGIPLVTILNFSVLKKHFDKPFWNDNLFKKNKTLSRYQFAASIFLTIGICIIIKTALQYKALSEISIMSFFFGIGILVGIFLTTQFLKSKLTSN